MKRSLSLTLTILIFFIFSITACSSNVDSKALSNVSFSLSSQACEKLRARAAESGNADGSLTLKVGLVAPYEVYSKQQSLANDEKGPITLTFEEIPVGTKIMAKAMIYQGEEEIAYGESGEIEVKEEGNELSVKLEYTKEFPKSATIEIKIDGETTVTANEIKLLATESKVRPSATVSADGGPIVEYEIFNISPDSDAQNLLKDFDLTWKIDGFEENEKGMTLKVYKDLLSNGPHTISLLAKNNDKKYYIGEIEVSVEREKEERVVFVSTERGLEFRINRFTTDNWFENTRLIDVDTDIIIVPIFEKGMNGWKGYWPFVEPNRQYQFVLEGSMGDFPIDETFKKNEMDYRRITLDPVTYIGERNTPITAEMKQIIRTFRSADDLSVDTSQGYARVSISEEQLGPFTTLFDIYKNDPYLKISKSFVTFTVWKEGWSWLAGYDYSVDDKMPSSLNNYDIIANLPEDDWGRKNVLSTLSTGDRFFIDLEPTYNFNGDKNQFFKISSKKSPTDGENMAVWQR